MSNPIKKAIIEDCIISLKKYVKLDF